MTLAYEPGYEADWAEQQRQREEREAEEEDDRDEHALEVASLEASADGGGACPWDDEDTAVENMESLVAAMHRDGTADDVAADGGEGEDMSDAQEQQEAQEASQSIKRIDEWIAGASLTELRRAYFGIEREVDRRKAENAQEAKELSAFEKPLRKTRSDAGRPRAPRESTVGGEELTARAERRAAS